MANRIIGAVVACLLILNACGGGGETEAEPEPAAAEELVVDETEAPDGESDSSGDEGQTDDTAAPVDDDETEAPTDDDETEAPAEDDNTAGTTPPLFGSFGGTLSFTSLRDDVTYEDEFLLNFVVVFF